MNSTTINDQSKFFAITRAYDPVTLGHHVTASFPLFLLFMSLKKVSTTQRQQLATTYVEEKEHALSMHLLIIFKTSKPSTEQ